MCSSLTALLREIVKFHFGQSINPVCASIAAGGGAAGGDGSGILPDIRSDSDSDSELVDPVEAVKAEQEAKGAAALMDAEMHDRKTRGVHGRQGQGGQQGVDGERHQGPDYGNTSLGGGAACDDAKEGGGERRRRPVVMRGGSPVRPEVGAALEKSTSRDSAQEQEEQPRIVFKEQWREKEARVWQEGIGDGHGFFYSQTTGDAGEMGADAGGSRATRRGPGRGLVPPKGWKLLPIIVKVRARKNCLAKPTLGYKRAIGQTARSHAPRGSRRCTGHCLDQIYHMN